MKSFGLGANLIFRLAVRFDVISKPGTQAAASEVDKNLACRL